ncbi:porin [Azospirillum picis]|uniref:porin n=1 Tax=Azospirillum picis TaxID=488438 RepID=UPI0027D7A651|nr:porin [Azospirillum picis]
MLYKKDSISDQKRFFQVDVSWGELEIGQTDGARSRLVAAGALPLTAAPGTGTAKLTYYTPPVRGFELGASYTPLPRGAAELPDPREALHLVEAAIRKTVTVGGVNARLTAGTSRARVRGDSYRLPRQSWIVGTQFTWQSVTFDGDLRQQEDSGGVAMRSLNAALAYGHGNMKLSLRVRHSEAEGADTTDRYLADLSYQLTPRWQLMADTAVDSGGESSGTVVKVGARLVF